MDTHTGIVGSLRGFVRSLTAPVTGAFFDREVTLESVPTSSSATMTSTTTSSSSTSTSQAPALMSRAADHTERPTPKEFKNILRMATQDVGIGSARGIMARNGLCRI
ncbi:MAG TPA: hypothetical protein PLV25_02490, partial [Opitutales bacterium]|nr:hypothetical protein [Opitutales bacterium]